MALVVAVFASSSAFLLALIAGSVLRRAFEQYQERYVTKSLQDLSGMFLFVSPEQVLWLNAAAFAVFAGVGFLFGGAFCAAILAIAGFFAPGAAVKMYRARRVRRFDVQLAEALQQLANALRAGLTLPQIVEQIGREAPAPLGQEFGLFSKQVKLGIPLEEALANMAARVGSEDLALVAVSTNIARQLGGNLAEMFDTIAGTVRERFRLEGKIAALTSQGKLQGWVVAGLPLAIGLFFSRYRPDLMEPMFEGLFGYVLVGAIALLEAIGFLLIRHIVAIDV
ncbi:MAG TPA: type II secretion system F family protein [Myxococcales bacterium]|jgi:tight adherence protein B